jgi:RNA polymerase sigma factor (sigma-70 family)
MLTIPPTLDRPTDDELLAAFVQRRDQAAFAELVRRYGPLVRAACRRALGGGPDADDAFQAVFLILARKAHTVRSAALLGPWLHTVAVRAAARARMQARRRQARERQVSAMPEPAADPPQEPNDWLPLLDAELQRLPERLRRPLVLCELQGLNRTEAARRLGIPEGTLSSRLARARDRLRRRLARAGAVVAGAAVAAALAPTAEAVPPELIAVTTRAAATGAASAPVAALTDGVLKAMLYAKLKIALIAVLTIGISAGTVVAVRYAPARADEAKPAAGKSDKDQLQGKWEFVSGQMRGKVPDEKELEEIKKHHFEFAGDKLKAKGEASFTLDSAKAPKQFDLKIEEGPAQEQGTWLGIYEIKGDDLTICIAPPGQDRPTEFASKEGTPIMLMKLKRVK